MRMFMRSVALFGVACILSSSAHHASEVASLRNELADMKTKMAAMESRLAAPIGTGTGASGFVSLKQESKVELGGDVNVDLIFKSRDDVPSDHDHVNSTEFHTNSANLRFRITPTNNPNVYLYIKLDLDDQWEDDRLDGVPDQDDMLEECKFVWNSVRGSAWGVVFGKGEVPYGQDQTLGIIQSYHHNDQTNTSEGPVFIVAGTEEVNFDLDGGVEDGSDNNPHADVGNINHPGEVDNVFQIGVNYIWKEIVKFEFAVFQNNDTDGNGSPTRGMHEDRSDDTMLFESWATRTWFMPTEHLTFEFSFIKKHIDSFDDKTRVFKNFGRRRSVEDEYAASIGFVYNSPNVPLKVFGEYQHGWDWAYTKNYHTDTAQLGFLWKLTPAINFGMMGEWLRIDDETTSGEDEYYKIVTHLRYNFEYNVYCILEYGYEYMDTDLAGTPADDDRNGHLVGFRTGLTF